MSSPEPKKNEMDPKSSDNGEAGLTKTEKNPKSSGDGETKDQRLKVFKIDPTSPPSGDAEEGATAGEDEDKDKTPVGEDGDSLTAAGASLVNQTPLTIVDYKGLTPEAFHQVLLSNVRTKIAPIMNESFRFCDKNGTIVQDQTTLASYWKLSTEENSVYLKSFKGPKTSTAGLLDNPPFLLKFVQRLKNDGTQKEGTLHSSSLPGLEGGTLALREIRKYVKAMSASTTRHRFCLDDGHAVDDSMTLKEYVASLSKMVEEEGQLQAIPSLEVYFCKPGVEKKSKRKEASDEVKERKAPEIELTLKEREAATRDKEYLEIQEKLDAAEYKLAEGLGDEAKSAGALTEDEWSVVIRNCNLMFGWVVDVRTNQINRAPKAAFQLRNGLNMESTPADPPAMVATINAAPSPDPADSTLAGTTSAAEIIKPTVTPKIPIPEKSQAIPNFVTNDDARIEITIASHQFQESMAKAHFSEKSIEASVSGGYGPVQVGISASYGDQSSDEKKNSRKKNEKTVIGTYRFPRATVHLTPSDLEPTQDLKNAVNRIRNKKNVADLRQLHKDFGHLFCHKVVIGGCLQTTKSLVMEDRSNEHSEKEQFKASVGASVNTPVANVSTKASYGEGQESNEGSQNLTSKERMVFEATGGNTILVSDPMRWTASLVNPNYWRAIGQDQIGSLAEALSQIPGYFDAPMWFMQAVPEMSRYVQIPRSRTFHVRMKAIADDPGMARLLKDGHKYLGHNSMVMPKPVRHQLKALNSVYASKFDSPYLENGKVVIDMTAFMETAGVGTDAIFFPASTQAPVLFSYTDKLAIEDDKNQPKTTQGGPGKQVNNSNDFKETVWRFEVPDGQVLAHESRVSIRSLEPESNPTLSVYRNQQGVYLPAMSGHDGPCFWRILKRDPTSREGDPIRDGDDIRLSWRFSDQTNGFRDFYDDIFGRRRFTKPEGAGDVLYLKVPFPAFQSTGGIALVMSSEGTVKPIIEPLNVLGSKKDSSFSYNLHDLSFRLDSAGDTGMGETMDYMAPLITQREVQRRQLSVPELVIGSILLSGIAGPIFGPMLLAILL